MSCRGLIKTIMFFVNFIFSLIGLGIFIVGILGVVYLKQIGSMYPDLTLSTYLGPSVVITGTIVFLISFSGCCGAIKEINCLLVLYTIVMFLLAAVKVAVAVYLITHKETTMTATNDYISKLNLNTEDAVSLHGIEFAAKCCGTTGPSSYVAANVTIPRTCCPLSYKETCDDKADVIYKQGCLENAASWIGSCLNTSIYVLMGIAVFEILSMMTAMYLICYRRKGDYYEYD